MKPQLIHVLLIAAVACGGRGGEEPSAPVAGTTDVPLAEAAEPAVEDSDAAQRAPDPAPVENNLPIRQPADPVLTQGGGVDPRANEQPAPAEDREPGPSREEWKKRAPQQYVIETCGYGLAPPSCSIEAVETGRLVSRWTRFLPDEPWAPAAIEDVQEPVTSLFEQAGSKPGSCTTSFQLDPVYAYPSQIYFDCGEEGWGLRVSCFEPDTLDSTVCQ